MSRVQACRHLCQEASAVLTSLRGGPLHLARGDLAQDLIDLRSRLLLQESDMNTLAATKDSETTATISEESEENLAKFSDQTVDQSSYALPFLQVIMDPRAAGPFTLVSLRAVYRLLQAGTLQIFRCSCQELTISILACKFEQTDASADEAVEMAIADVLKLLVVACPGMPTSVIMDAFNTVFVTRNTFIHSPALCYHFEDVLRTMVGTAFDNAQTSTTQAALLEFLVNQLLHTPLVGGELMDESSREAAAVHDDTRTLCLRLVRCAVQKPRMQLMTVLPILQDDLCLSLLMTGQAIWAGEINNLNGASFRSPGFVSLEVLSEICATIQVLWNTVPLRQNLIVQFETILTGFYTRALVLLRKRSQPVNSVSYSANILFDAEVEIILESLVDILCLHNHSLSVADGDGGSLETIFSYYDCHMRRSDVATQLFVELSRCCGGTVNAEGEAVILTPSSSFNVLVSDGDGYQDDSIPLHVDHPKRPVPAHLKELCAQALMGGMKCLFCDDHASAATLLERSQRKRSIMLKQMESTFDSNSDLNDDNLCRPRQLRDLKSRKRLLTKAAHIFNKKASRGIEFLIDSGLVVDPISPESLAHFLRNGIVVGLNKTAVGAYLGEAGKSAVAGKSPAIWERDWFHKEVLTTYCSLFRFEGQTLVDGLRMFLATFRLPGEAQQIDRILQAFSDRCSQACEEASTGRLKLFSNDPKRASDAAYLLSFSIIMLNTDRHNANIREDRKMSRDDFVKNNSDYGRDITEKGKEFPREYLVSIYDSINEEEIRTEGEGAEGAMTVERWKDVLRGSSDILEEREAFVPSINDAEDLSELVLEHVWKPIISAIAALWNVAASSSASDVEHPLYTKRSSTEGLAHGNMLGVQGARLGMDMSLEMLQGVGQLGRIDIFQRMFLCICDYSGLVGNYSQDSIERTLSFCNSLESQAAFIVAIRTALTFMEDLDEECWKRVWAMLFELRDLNLLSATHERGLLRESDPDFLNEHARIDWTICLIKGDMDYVSRSALSKGKSKNTGLLSAFGRALFGNLESEHFDSDPEQIVGNNSVEPTIHGKESLFVWNEKAVSDEEDSIEANIEMPTKYKRRASVDNMTAGAKLENLLVCENIALNSEDHMPVTGLERVEETRQHQASQRARVRIRLRKSCDFASLVAESRFMDKPFIICLLHSLVGLVSLVSNPAPLSIEATPTQKNVERSSSDISISTDGMAFHMPSNIMISPASEAFAEVLLCELALKNKDRLEWLWTEVLQDHYMSRLARMLVNPDDGPAVTSKVPVDPGLEKRVTGLLRLTICAVQRQDMTNEILSAWKYLLPMNDEQHKISRLRALDRHIGEGLWRIVSQVDRLSVINDDGWEGLMSMLNWCAKRGAALKPLSPRDYPSRFAEDDPALQCFRSMHLLINTKDMVEMIPCSIVNTLLDLIIAGEQRNYAQLSIASLDLLDILRERKHELEAKRDSVAEIFWNGCWRKMVEGIAKAVEISQDSDVRQHALSIMTDLFLQKQENFIPLEYLTDILSEVCIPLAGRCIKNLQIRELYIESTDQLMMEFELCIGLIFKPLRYHTKMFMEHQGHLSTIWRSILVVLEEILGKKETLNVEETKRQQVLHNCKATMDSLANEHLRNAIQLLLSMGVLSLDSGAPGDLSVHTWDSVGRMGMNVQELKLQAAKSTGGVAFLETVVAEADVVVNMAVAP